MKIISLSSQNVLRLNAVQITPEGNIIIIGGDNEQGKTSVLDSIFLSMGGRLAKHKKPLKKGTKMGKAKINLGDLTVTRTFTEKGSSLTVKSKDGSIKSSPQKILDQLTGQLTFDPLAFSSMEDDKQLKVLKDLCGLNFSDLDIKKKEIYDERTGINRQIKEIESSLSDINFHDDISETKEVSVSSLIEELEKINQHNENIADQQQVLSEKKSQYKENEERIKTLDDEIKSLRAENLVIKAEGKKLKSQIQDPIDPTEIKSKINNSEELNQKIRENQTYKSKQSELSKLQATSQSLTDSITNIEDQKTKSISEAKLPIPELSFDETGVLYKSIPFSQCSSAERLRVSVAMGIAMNPELKVLLIRDGSLLDKKNLKLITQMAEKSDHQIWMERVGQGKECSVIIEDGYVKGMEKIELNFDHKKEKTSKAKTSEKPEKSETLEVFDDDEDWD